MTNQTNNNEAYTTCEGDLLIKGDVVYAIGSDAGLSEGSRYYVNAFYGDQVCLEEVGNEEETVLLGHDDSWLVVEA